MRTARRRLGALMLTVFGSSGLSAGCDGHDAAPRVSGGDPALGEDLLRGYTCGGCHVIPGVTAADGLVGPPLTDWASRAYIAGAVWNTPENLIRWIMDPAAIEPGTTMPDLDVREDQARHMAAYLFTLGGDGSDGPPRLFPVEWLERLGPGDKGG
jgi:cytochrome c